MAGWAVEPEGAGEPWAAPLERRLTADLSGGILWDHGVGGELGVQDAAVCVGVHGQRVQQLPVLQHPRVQQAARLGDQLRHVLCRVKAQVLAAPARAQALVSGSLACPGQLCATLLRQRAWLRHRVHSNLSLCALPLPGQECRQPMPRDGQTRRISGKCTDVITQPHNPHVPWVSADSLEFFMASEFVHCNFASLRMGEKTCGLQKRAKI